VPTAFGYPGGESTKSKASARKPFLSTAQEPLRTSEVHKGRDFSVPGFNVITGRLRRFSLMVFPRIAGILDSVTLGAIDLASFQILEDSFRT